MKGTATVVFFAGMLFACAPVPPSNAPPPIAAAPPAASAPAPQPPDEPRTLAVRTVSCGGVLRATEEDRAAASMFYLGYTASRLGIRTINTGEVEGLVTTALEYCAAHPDRPAVGGFLRAFRESRR
jgi:hypothetical protein